MARPRGRPIATRGVFPLEDPARVLPAAVGLDTSFVVEALIESQPLHVVCAAFLERLVEVDTTFVTSDLLEIELRSGVEKPEPLPSVVECPAARL